MTEEVTRIPDECRKNGQKKDLKATILMYGGISNHHLRFTKDEQTF